MLDIPYIYLIHAKYMIKICLRNTWYIFEICLRYTWDMSDTSLIFAWDMPEISLIYAGDFPNICPRSLRYSWNMSEKCPSIFIYLHTCILVFHRYPDTATNTLLKIHSITVTRNSYGYQITIPEIQTDIRYRYPKFIPIPISDSHTCLRFIQILI